MNKDFISQVAAEYLAAKHEPDHPSYKAFCRETVAQFRGLVNSGYKFAMVSSDPYPDSDSMFSDIENKRLAIFTGGSLVPDNPLLTKRWYSPDNFGSLIAGRNVNEMFRAVHDILGHYPNRSPYETFEGELAAYQEHKKWYSPEALPALYSETIGQLCVYYATGDFIPVQENKILEVRL